MAVKTFSAGAILTAADTNTYLANSGLVYVTSYTVGSGVSTFSVPDAFGGDFNNYRVIYSGGTGTGTSAGLRLTLTGSSTAYFNSLQFTPYTGGITAISNNNSLGYWQYAGAVDSNSNALLSVDIFEPYLARSTRFFSQWIQTDAAGSNAGIHKANTSYTGITVVPDTGTLTGGTVTVYGYRKA
jgi:hypothetical protein